MGAARAGVRRAGGVRPVNAAAGSAGNAARSAAQFVKYGLCGGLATAVDLAVFYGLSLTLIPTLLPDDPLVRRLSLSGPFVMASARARNYVLARAIAFVFSNLTAYVTNVLWVFERGRHRRHVEVGLFYLVSGVSLAVGTAVGWSLIALGGRSTSFSLLANVAASMLINYVCRKHIVFKG